MYKLCVYIPSTHLEPVKEALFAAGAGSYQHYSQCCWQVLGTGQFQPEVGSMPSVGKQNHLETISEYRVEMMVTEANITAVCCALHIAHPYEVPAYDIIQVFTLQNLPKI